MKVTRIEFYAPVEVGATVVSQVFGSAPLPEEAHIWASREALAEYCQTYPPERADIGGYYVPTVDQSAPMPALITPSSGRVIEFDPDTNRWTVDFGDEGSVYAAGQLLQALSESALEPYRIDVA